ncbi:MAG: hypothetical protein ACXVZN_02250, partial [Gaiellaceae bacterium]
MTIARFLLEAGFLVLVAAAVGLAGLGWVWIAVVMFCAWLLVAVVERSESRSGADRPSAEAEPVSEPPATSELQPEPEAQPEPEPVAKPALSVAPPPPPPPEPEPEPEPEVVVPLVRRDATPREWNVWDLERITSEQEGRNPARDE